MAAAPSRAASKGREARDAQASARAFAPALLPVLAALSLLLAACGTRPPAPPSAEAAGAPLSAERPAAAYAYAVPAPPPERRIDPAGLIGLDETAISAALGEPGFVRKETGARVWQYFAGDCILDLFLYQEDEGQAFRAVYYELRSRIPEDPGRCPRDKGFALKAAKG